MTFQKIISLLQEPIGGDVLAEQKAINVDSIFVEEKFVQPPPIHPRPTLPSRVAIIGNYLPRKCGIATFTTDLCDAIHAEYGADRTSGLAGE